MSKNKRLSKIREIITNSKVSSQDDLLALLQKEGFSLTQATLSRDLKLLKVAKVPDGDVMIYAFSDSNAYTQSTNQYTGSSLPGLISLDYSGNMIVIKTLPGYANAVAIGIDEMNIYEILGTIAGDDTILLIVREGAKPNDVINIIQSGITKNTQE